MAHPHPRVLSVARVHIFVNLLIFNEFMPHTIRIDLYSLAITKIFFPKSILFSVVINNDQILKRV